MSITKLEDKLFQANFKSEESRLNAYLSVHATLFKYKDVPRIYIPHQSPDINKILSHVLYSDLNHITENTNKSLNALGLSTKSIQDLCHDDKTELLASIEDLLLNGWGSGKIHYEFLRIFPKEKCDLLEWLSSLNVNDDKLNLLKSILSKRKNDAISATNDLDTTFSPGFRRYHPTILSKSYQLLIEKQWKNNWAHQTNYFVNNKLVESLLLIEDL